MSDPRLTPRPDASGSMWAWIAGIAVLVLIAVVLIAGWNGNERTASNQPNPAATTGSAPIPDKMAPSAKDKMMPPNTTGAAPANPTTPSPDKQ